MDVGAHVTIECGRQLSLSRADRMLCTQLAPSGALLKIVWTVWRWDMLEEPNGSMARVILKAKPSPPPRGKSPANIWLLRLAPAPGLEVSPSGSLVTIFRRSRAARLCARQRGSTLLLGISLKKGLEATPAHKTKSAAEQRAAW